MANIAATSGPWSAAASSFGCGGSIRARALRESASAASVHPAAARVAIALTIIPGARVAEVSELIKIIFVLVVATVVVLTHVHFELAGRTFTFPAVIPIA